MKKQIVRISSEKLARIIHMELMDVGFFHADEAYEALASAGRGSITIAVSDDVNVFEVEELEENEYELESSKVKRSNGVV